MNVTVPAVDPQRAHDIVAKTSSSTAKVKVAEPGQNLSEDEARVEAVRDALGPKGMLRVDANGAWSVDQAQKAIKALDRYELEYAEQPVATLEEMALLRRSVDVPLAADESVRTADDPLRIAGLEAADVVVLKVQPLGGVRRALDVAEAAGLPCVVSSALGDLGRHRGRRCARREPALAPLRLWARHRGAARWRCGDRVPSSRRRSDPRSAGPSWTRNCSNGGEPTPRPPCASWRAFVQRRLCCESKQSLAGSRRDTGGRVRSQRCDPRRARSGVSFGTAGPCAGRRATSRPSRRYRRAIRSLPRTRIRAGDRPTCSARMHLGHRRGQLSSRPSSKRPTTGCLSSS